MMKGSNRKIIYSTEIPCGHSLRAKHHTLYATNRLHIENDQPISLFSAKKGKTNVI